MKVVNEKDRKFRFGESGPKYLMRGSNIDFGIVRLIPGETLQNHYHNHIEENFYILEGEIEFLINNEKTFKATPGDLVHIEPTESHLLKNVREQAALAVFVKAPYDPDDKVDVD